MIDDSENLQNGVAALIREVADDLITPAQAGVALLADQDEPVTSVDLEAERRLRTGLRSPHPMAVVVGEEEAKEHPRLLDVLERPHPVWLVDPIDGTGNYAAGTLDFGTMIALVVERETRLAWIWSRRDQAIYTVARGAGVRRDGRPLAATRRGRTTRGQVLDRFMDERTATALRSAVAPATLIESTQSAAVDYPALIEGRIDFSVYGRVRPWDHAAGALLVEEVGGRALTLNGRRYRPSLTDGGLVVAVDRSVPDRIVAAMDRPDGR